MIVSTNLPQKMHFSETVRNNQIFYGESEIKLAIKVMFFVTERCGEQLRRIPFCASF